MTSSNSAEHTLTVPEILQRLESFPSGPLPADVLAAAVSRREEITPELLRVLAEAVEQPEAVLAKEGYWLHMFAIFLLAEFKETDAYPLFVRLARLPEALLYDLLGDCVTEDLPRLLVAVHGGDIGPIQGLVVDRTVYDYVRWSSLRALCLLVVTGERTRPEIVAYLLELLRGKLEREPSAAWDGLVDCALNLHPGELMPELKRAYEEELPNPGCVSWEEVEDEAALDPALALAKLPRKERAFTTVIGEMSGWHCFRPFAPWRPEPKLNLPDSDLPGNDYAIPAVPYVAPAKIGRNDPCPCGSGKKYKKCCLDRA